MQCAKYQHFDGTTDYAPYKPNWPDSYQSHYNDWMIMLLRVKASARGAHPVDIQKAVQTLGGE